ncbi:hypothetical protein EJB05_35672, partial [Eragrostis curvula]
MAELYKLTAEQSHPNCLVHWKSRATETPKGSRAEEDKIHSCGGGGGGEGRCCCQNGDGDRQVDQGPAIGRGSSATVSLAVDRRTGAVFAVKSVDAARAGELRREQSILLILASSPHVVRCLGGSDCELFLEYAPGGSLADEIKRRGSGRCEERLVRSRARDVLRLASRCLAAMAELPLLAPRRRLASRCLATMALALLARAVALLLLPRRHGSPCLHARTMCGGKEKIPVSEVSGCCGCCKSRAVPSETKRIVGIICAIGSWCVALITTRYI